MHPGLNAPWLGLQLRRGNSLIGARRAVWKIKQLTDGDFFGKDAVIPRLLAPGEPRGADDVLWSFSAVTSEYRLTIRNAIIPRTGGPVGDPNCTVEFVDAVNTYVGACGSDPLSDEQPCRFTSVGFEYEDRVMGLLGPTLSTSLVCEGVVAPSTPILVRNLSAPDVRGESRNGLIPINIVNCEGMPLP